MPSDIHEQIERRREHARADLFRQGIWKETEETRGGASAWDSNLSALWDGRDRARHPAQPDRAPIRDLLTRYFDPSGLFVGSPLQTLPPLLAAIENLPARERPFVSVAEAVREHLALLQDREEVAQQKEWFLDQVKRGRHRTERI